MTNELPNKDDAGTKGIMEILRDAPTVEYDPSKGITIEELGEWAAREMKRKPQTPEYLLSKWEAENLPLWQLTWLGNNYRVLVSLEVSNIIKQREENEKRNTKG